MRRFSASGTAEPSHMWLWNSGRPPASTRSRLIASRGLTNPSSLSGGQWSVCSATSIGYWAASSLAQAAKARPPTTMSLRLPPDQ